MKELTFEILEAEFRNWMNKFGKGRNESSIRFGQHMWINYDLDKLFNYGPDDQRDGAHDGFSTEDAIVAYSIFSSKLVEKLNTQA